MRLTVAALAAIAIGFLTGRWWSVAAAAVLVAPGVPARRRLRPVRFQP